MIYRNTTLLNYVISDVSTYALKERERVFERITIVRIAETAFLGFNERDNAQSHASLEHNCRD